MKEFFQKITILLFVFNFIELNAQVSHSFFSTEYNGIERHAVVFATPNGNVFATLKNSEEDSLVIVFGEMDSEGETTEYAATHVSGIEGTVFSISGYAFSGNEVVLAILADRSPTMDLVYVKLNRTTNSLVGFHRVNEDFRRGHVRTRQKGNEVITYLSTNANDFVRVTTSFNSIANNSISIIGAGETYSGSLNNYRKMVELLIDPNGNEYAQKDSKLFKRKTGGTISSLTLPAWQALNAYDLLTSSNARLNVFCGTKFNVIDTSNLSVVNSGDINGINVTNFQRLEAVYTSTGFTLFGQSMSNPYLHVLQLDPLFNVITQKEMNSRFTPFDLQISGSDYLLCGNKDELAGQSLNSLALIKGYINDLPAEFTEYGSRFEHYALSGNTAHCNLAFRNLDNWDSGLSYTFGGQSRSVLFNVSQGLLGMNSNMEINGMPMGYYTSDFAPGPYTEYSISATRSYDAHNRAYYVSKELIDYHLQNYSDPSYIMPFGIKRWPAHGDVALNQTADLAPFHDSNNNSIYEPDQGDYPLIYGDQCYLNVYHIRDSTESFETSNTPFEVLRYIYMFSCDTNEALQNTIFIRQEFTILDDELNDAYASVYTDYDVGSYSDDYVGTNVDLGMIYTYNGDLYDEDNAGFIGFHDTIAAAGTLLLKGAPTSPDGSDNAPGIGSGLTVNGFGYSDGIIDNEYLGLTSSLTFTNSAVYPYADPSNPSQTYNTAQGLYTDGSYQMLAGIPVYHSFYGDNDSQFYSSNGVDPGTTVSEYAPSINPPGDRRILGSSGPFDMDANDPNKTHFVLHTAYVVAVDTLSGPTSTIQDPVNKLFDLGQTIKNMFNSNQVCGAVFDPYISTVGIAESSFDFAIYPNPVSTELSIHTNLSGELQLHVSTLGGNMVFEGSVQAQDQIQTAGWESGIYLLQLSNGVEILNRKVVKL